MKLKDILKEEQLNESWVVQEMDDRMDHFKEMISQLERVLIDRGLPAKDVNKVGMEFNNKILKPYDKLVKDIIRRFRLR